jgi:HK97 family phage portal protein
MKTQSNQGASMQPIKNTIRNYLAKRLFGVGPTDDWSYVDQFQGPAKDIKLLGMYSGITYRCIDTIATSVGGKYEPYLYTVDTKGKKTTISNHPFIQLLEQPNPDITKYQLFEGSASFMEQFGECFWYMVPGAKSGYGMGVKEIYLLRPDRMGITLNKTDGSILGYTYSSGTANNKIPFKPEEIIHHMTFNPKNPYRGYSTLEAAIEYVQTELEVSRFTKNYFSNNAAMSGVLSVTSKMSKEAWQKFVRQWRERYQGVANAGKVGLVRDSQFQFTPVASNIQDMQLTDLKQSTIDNILMMWKIPKGLMGMESGEGLGRASVETLEYIYAKWTIDDKLCRWDDTLKRCMQRYYPNDKFLVDHLSIIPTDKDYELAVNTAGVDKWLTRNDIRAKDPLTASVKIDGDDQLYVPINMVPLSSDTTSADKSTTITDGTTESVKFVKAKKKVGKSLKFSVEQKEAFRLNLQANATTYVRVYSKAMKTALERQHEKVLGNLKHLAASWMTRDLSDDLFDMGDEDQNMDDEITPVQSDLAETQGALALVFAGDHDTKYQLSQSVMNALKKSTKRMSQNFNQETLDRLNATLTEGISAGEGLGDLNKRVAAVYDQATSYRTERVARTESQYASNAATLDAYEQTTYVVYKEWFANPDACEYCQEMDGTQVGLEEVFVNQGDSVDVHNDDGSTDSYDADYSDIGGPPLHPNCECTIIPVTE